MFVARVEGQRTAFAQAAVRGAVAAFEAGEEPRAAALLEEARMALKKTPMPGVRELVEAVGAALTFAGHPDPATEEEALREAHDLERVHRPGDAAAVLSMLARTHAARGDAEGAGRCLARAARLARKAGHRSLAARLEARADSLAGT
jgi:ATP/maltotriose-dependent transcriptional regulator MalT